jgi:hypothetical protein
VANKGAIAPQIRTAFFWWSWISFGAQITTQLLLAFGSMHPSPGINALAVLFSSLQKRAEERAADWEKPRRQWTNTERNAHFAETLRAQGWICTPPPEQGHG